MDQKDVVIYISENNNHCNKVIKLMEERDISYRVKNVSRNKDYMKELQRNGIYGTPALFIEGQDDSILGYQKNKIIHALNNLPIK